ncbi:exocyst complex component 8, partial [Asbolus verrucosus]
VRDLSQNCVGGPELRRLRKKIQALSEETNNNLKKNVYHNYMQFIDTAKEISHLESEMYQLSHLLSEQKSLLGALSTTSILGDETPVITEVENKDNANEQIEDNRQKLASILEKVEGCKELLEVPGRTYLYEGDLLEVDPVDNNTIKMIHAYLFTDGFMTTYRNTNSRGLMKYIFEVMYELGSLAVVNVREIGNNKHQFKLLIFPDTRVFQCTTSSNKKEWLDKFDQAKKARLTQEQQKRESIVEKSPSRAASIDSPSINLDQRHNNLTEVLMKELEVNPDKSLQGGLRAARRAVRLLNQLGRSTQACNLFLKLCSCMLKTQCKRVKREGSTTMYVRHLSSVVFTNMCHMTEEFLRAFPSSSSCSSAYVVWASNELSLFTTHFIKQAFMPQTSLSTLTECVVLVRSQCERLCSFGVDLCYQLDGALRTPLMQALKDARDKATEVAKLRALEDKWIPLNLRSKSGLARFLQEYSEMGLKLDSYVTGDIWIQLTSNTVVFTKSYLILLDDCLRLKTTELLYTINEVLYDVFEAQIRHIEASLRNESQHEQRQFITKNAEFLLVTLQGLCQKKYSEVNGFECVSLKKLQKEYSALLKGVSPTSR